MLVVLQIHYFLQHRSLHLHLIWEIAFSGTSLSLPPPPPPHANACVGGVPIPKDSLPITVTLHTNQTGVDFVVVVFLLV